MKAIKTILFTVAFTLQIVQWSDAGILSNLLPDVFGRTLTPMPQEQKTESQRKETSPDSQRKETAPAPIPKPIASPAAQPK